VVRKKPRLINYRSLNISSSTGGQEGKSLRVRRSEFGDQGSEAKNQWPATRNQLDVSKTPEDKEKEKSKKEKVLQQIAAYL
jgi:hypothetical protein